MENPRTTNALAQRVLMRKIRSGGRNVKLESVRGLDVNVSNERARERSNM